MMKKILVIDDDNLVLQSVDRILKKEGYATELARNAVEALEKARSNSFDLIISDIRMPGENGVEAIRQIRRLFNEKIKKDIPIILLTNLGQKEDVERGTALGAVDYIVKAHFTPSEVVKKVKQFLK